MRGDGARAPTRLLATLAAVPALLACPTPTPTPPTPDASIPAPTTAAPTPASPTPAFAPCHTAADCHPPSDRCLSELDAVEDGVCTTRCGTSCERGQCVRAPLVADASSGWCLPPCQTHGDCRTGWRCALLDRSEVATACLPPGIGVATEGTCQHGLERTGAIFTPIVRAPEESNGLICAVPDAVLLHPTIAGVEFLYLGKEPRPLLVDCDLALALHRMASWLHEHGIRQVDHVGTTHCRWMANGNRPSQHAFGRAIDVRGLVDRRGQRLSVLHDWRDKEAPRGRLLHDLARHLHEAFVFNVVLTPEYNQAHADHLHLDLTPDAHFLELDDQAFLVGE